MSRAILSIHTAADRQKAVRWVMKAPAGTRIEFKGARRSTDQNSLLWAMLTDIASQVEHSGRKYNTNEWKIIFMHAISRETQFIPSLDGKTFIPWGQSSRDLSKEEMSNLIEFMMAWGTENGVTFHDGFHAPSQLEYLAAG